MQYLIILFALTTLTSCTEVKNNYKRERIDSNIDLTKDIIGDWEFVETRDTKGNKLKDYKGSFGAVKATGPKLVYNKDKSYSMIFTPVNSDVGFWKYNSETSTIEHDLFVDSISEVGKDLIKTKLAIKKYDGNYYELIEYKLINFEKGTMLIENRGLIDVYNKVK